MGNIRNRFAVAGGLWDFEVWNDNFSRLRPGIRPTDIDGLVHYRSPAGQDFFLVLEGAKLNKRPEKGQDMAHRALGRQKNWTVVRWWGTPGTWQIAKFQIIHGGYETDRNSGTLEDLTRVIDIWIAAVIEGRQPKWGYEMSRAQEAYQHGLSGL